MKEGLKLPRNVRNIDLIQEIGNLFDNSTNRIFISKVAAHTGGRDIHSIGNDRADFLAKQGVLL